jgi:hypothetical protein
MNTIPTAEEVWFKNTGNNINQMEYSAMIEFAKLHVEAALKAAYNNSECVNKAKFSGDQNWQVDENSILNSYPLDNIK